MVTKKKTPIPDPEPEPTADPGDDAQCPAVDGDGTRCLFVIHGTGEHAFTEDDAAAAEGATAAAEEDADVPEAPGEPEAAPEATPEPPEAIPALRVSENAWWCGLEGCDTAMQHSVTACSTCRTPRG